ncbi:hypothetical protein B0H13DRAFT_2651662 [Mycena leptocephala]|nr:hypothetical protein B0H13DRAFT_2651662 [Mycena leptocephala]
MSPHVGVDAGYWEFGVIHGGIKGEVMADTLNEILIIIVVSSWVNIALYTLELVLCARYFARPSRPLAHKIGVGVLVFFDTVCTVAVGFDVCLAVLHPPVTPANPRLLFTPLAVEIIATYVSSVISQLFLCNLLYILTGNGIVAVVLLLLIFTHLGFSWASAILILKAANHTGFAFTTSAVGAISCAATDAIVAACLAWKFWMMMTHINSENSTRSLLRRILILSVSSGAICAGNTLLMMILLLKGSEFFDFFFSSQGRVYALTILGNFLVGTPAGSRNETTPSRGLRTSLSNIVVFRSMAVETVLHPADASTPKSTDRLRFAAGGPSLSYANHLHERLDEELALGPLHGKTDSGEGLNGGTASYT